MYGGYTNTLLNSLTPREGVAKLNVGAPEPVTVLNSRIVSMDVLNK